MKPRLAVGTLATAKRWLAEYRARCSDFELQQELAALQWLAPTVREKAGDVALVAEFVHVPSMQLGSQGRMKK